MTQTATKQSSIAGLEPPRFEDGKAMLIAGLREHYTPETMENIPRLWQRFAPYIGNIPGQTGRATYGLCFNAHSPEGIDYLAGVEVSSLSGLREGFSQARIPAQRYAVFPHREGVSKLYQTLEAIDRQWFPNSGYEVTQPVPGAPSFFERYGEKFDPRTGVGDIEVWIPIKT